MTRIIVILLLICCYFRGNCQNGDNTDNNFCLKFAPFALIDPYSGTSIRLGVETKLEGKYALSSEIGTFLKHSFINSIWLKNNSGALINLELKRYLEKEQITNGLYVSLELLYKYQSYTTTDTIAINGSPKYSKDYAVYKNLFCTTIKYGVMDILKFGIIMDVSLGLGGRFRFSKSGLTSDENENILSASDYSTNVYSNKAGQFIYPNVEIAIKLGYSLR